MLRNQIQLKKWGLDKNYTRTLNKFIIRNCSTEIHPLGISLVVHLERISAPFWMSLFVPSICLIMAAEATLFIDETHFEALIMVALTSNLVTYTLYNAVQDALPDDSSLKLIDMWLLHGLLMPMIVFLVLVINELMSKKARGDFHEKKGTKVANSTIVVSPKNSEEEGALESRWKKCMCIGKMIIPITSVLFMIMFFAICLIK